LYLAESANPIYLVQSIRRARHREDPGALLTFCLRQIKPKQLSFGSNNIENE